MTSISLPLHQPVEAGAPTPAVGTRLRRAWRSFLASGELVGGDVNTSLSQRAIAAHPGVHELHR